MLAWAGAVWAVHALELSVFTFTRSMVGRDIDMGRVAREVLGAAYAIGLLLGGPLFGALADARGRRTALLLAMTLSLLGFALLAAAQSQSGVLAARVLAGVGLGGELPATVTLVFELAPPGKRPLSVALLPAFAGAGGAAGVLAAFFVAPVTGWRGLYAALSALVLLVAAAREALPESPLWLTSVGRADEALEAVTKHERGAASHWESSQALRTPLLRGGSMGARAAAAAEDTAAPASTSTRCVLLVSWGALAMSTLALGSYLPSLISLTGFNVYAAWPSCVLLYVAQTAGSVLVSAMLRLGYHQLAEDDRRATLAVFAATAAASALGLSYLPTSSPGVAVATAAALVSASLAAVWSVVFAATPDQFTVAWRGRGVGLAAALAGLSNIFGVLIVLPRFYNVWMLSARALAWGFGAVLVAVATVLVPRFGLRGRLRLKSDGAMGIP